MSQALCDVFLKGRAGQAPSEDVVVSLPYVRQVHCRMQESVVGFTSSGLFLVEGFSDRALLFLGYMRVFSGKIETSRVMGVLVIYSIYVVL